MTEKPTYEDLEQRIKDLEQELVKRHEVEKELNLTLDATTEGIWSWKFKTNDFYFSPQYYKMLGYKPDEFSPDFENWLDLIHPDDREKSLEIASEFLKSKPDLYENEFRLRTKNDGYRWIKTVGKVVERDESGDAVYMIGNHEDITEIKSALNALIEERERFELAMKFTNDGLFDWNLETNQIHYSSGWKRMLGYSDDEIKNEFSEWERLTKFEDMKASWDMLNEVLEGKRDHFEKEFKMQHKDGHWVDILARANVVFNEDGKGVRVVGTHVDITERKQIEQSLYESEARFKALHNASFGGIALHDKGIILECNQGLSEMTGYSMTELIGMNGLLLLIAEKARTLVMQNILSGYEKPYEAVGLRKNGEEYPMRLEARNIPYKGKNVRVVEFRDITEQKRVEKELLLTQYSINHIADQGKCT
ncbi:MAG: PAS domain-containing protein [Desulfamplus sp.]